MTLGLRFNPNLKASSPPARPASTSPDRACVASACLRTAGNQLIAVSRGKGKADAQLRQTLGDFEARLVAEVDIQQREIRRTGCNFLERLATLLATRTVSTPSWRIMSSASRAMIIVSSTSSTSFGMAAAVRHHRRRASSPRGAIGGHAEMRSAEW